jgi:hypothetical protein
MLRSLDRSLIVCDEYMLRSLDRSLVVRDEYLLSQAGWKPVISYVCYLFKKSMFCTKNAYGENLLP